MANGWWQPIVMNSMGGVNPMVQAEWIVLIQCWKPNGERPVDVVTQWSMVNGVNPMVKDVNPMVNGVNPMVKGVNPMVNGVNQMVNGVNPMANGEW